MKTLFRNSSEMDALLVHRCAALLAFFVSNNLYQWPFARWSHVLEVSCCLLAESVLGGDPGSSCQLDASLERRAYEGGDDDPVHTNRPCARAWHDGGRAERLADNSRTRGPLFACDTSPPGTRGACARHPAHAEPAG